MTSEDVCWSMRNVKFINESFYNMRCLIMSITAVGLLFFVTQKKYNSIPKTVERIPFS